MGRESRIKKPEKRNEYHGNHYVVNDEQVIFRPYETPTNEGRNEREINELVNITHNQLYDEFEAFRKQELNELASVDNLEQFLLSINLNLISYRDLGQKISKYIKEKI